MNRPEILAKLNKFGLVPDEVLTVKMEKKTTVKEAKIKVDFNHN